jgi:acetylornithine deacetylase/succinyl-diaminopimelate desuccinylase-like protein
MSLSREMLRAVTAFAVWGLVVSAPSAQAPAPALPSPAAVISASALMDTVRTLASADYEGRAAGTPGGAKARAWLRDRLQRLGLRPMGDSLEHPFAISPRGRDAEPAGTTPAPLEGVNLLGLCPGTDPGRPVIVLSAHYDHVGIRNGRIFPGADDNASGVATLLEIARVCVDQPFRHGLLIAALDAEETGLQGARAFLSAPPVARDRIALDVNLDMIARGDKGEIYVSGLHHNPTLKPLLDPVAARAPITVRFGHDLPGTGDDDWTMQSDHGVFHQAGIPFVYFGVEDHADYHQPTDTAERIDPDFFAKAAAVVLDALRALDAGLR